MSTRLRSVEDTRPYLSLVLARSERPRGGVAVGALLGELKEGLSIRARGSERRLVSESLEERDGEFAYGWVHYVQERPPSWLLGSELEILDRTHYLLLACGLPRYFAFFGQDVAFSALLGKRLRSHDGAFKELRPIPHRTLADAFVQGVTRTLWLSGIHRRTSVKADSKILSGLDLRAALSPLEDQTYHFTAARSVVELAGKERPVGAAQRRSSVWIGPSRDWPDFRRHVEDLVAALERAERTPTQRDAPFPYLAVPTTDWSAVSSAFDVSIVPPELLSDETSVDPDALQLAEKWAYRASFEVTPTNHANALAIVLLDGVPLAKLKVTVAPDTSGDAVIQLEDEPLPGGSDDDLDEMRAVCGNPRWLKIRYESGHTLSDGQLFLVQYRDLPFLGWRFATLNETGSPPETDPKKEKPTAAANPQQFLHQEIGRHTSLFCWVQRHWFGLSVPGTTDDPRYELGSGTGWLACDDGAGEIADFIHLDLAPSDGESPRVTLIHVKGSKTAGPTRGLSVSDYEVVCGQAVKNLRSLDQLSLAEALARGAQRNVAEATWESGVERGNRAGLIAALEHLGTNYRRRVVVFQPRVTRTEQRQAQADIDARQDTPRAARLKQLNTLLLGVDLDCRALGAEFFVLTSDL